MAEIGHTEIGHDQLGPTEIGTFKIYFTEIQPQIPMIFTPEVPFLRPLPESL